jgi:serine-type D-Ala-D-Ala carboxypeptidase (penicillin-binding protein 5/6)
MVYPMVKRRLFWLFLMLLALGVIFLAPTLGLVPVKFAWPGEPTITPDPAPVLTPQGQPPSISAASAFLLDDDSGNTLADINGEQERTMASTTKIMTALVALQRGKLDQLITVHEDAIQEVEQNDGSNASLNVDEQLTLRDLLYALLLPSGDDAAVAIADGLAGSQAGFVQMMNQEALQLHLTHTHYGNVDGLFSDNHYTTAHELAILAHYALRQPLFAQIVQTRTYQLPPTDTHLAHSWMNTNNLLWTYAGATGVKTGYTGDAGACLVFSATRGGHHLIGAVLDSSTEDSRFSDAQKLLDWGFGLSMRRPRG